MKFKNILPMTFLIFSKITFALDMPVAISHSGDDLVGKRIVYFLKENIQKSTSMHITTEDAMRMEISIVTMEKDSQYPGTSSVYSVTWLWNNTQTLFPYYLTSSVGYCGTDRVQGCAESLTAMTYEQVEGIFSLIKAAAKYEAENDSKQNNRID